MVVTKQSFNGPINEHQVQDDDNVVEGSALAGTFQLANKLMKHPGSDLRTSICWEAIVRCSSKRFHFVAQGLYICLSVSELVFANLMGCEFETLHRWAQDNQSLNVSESGTHCF